MHRQQRKFRDLILIFSGFFIPVNIYIIGNWLGAGVQFALFRVQITTKMTYISLFRDIEFVFYGLLSARTGVDILLWAVSALVLAFAAFLYLFLEEIIRSNNDRKRASSQKFIGLCIIVSATIFLISMIAQYGPLFHGASGFAIPVGVPLLVYSGYTLYRSAGTVETPWDRNISAQHTLRDHLKNPRYFFALTCFFTIFFTLNYFLYVFPGSGGDLGTYCSAVDLWNHHKNPYIIEEITQSKFQYWGFYYPPATLLLFTPLCNLVDFVYSLNICFPAFLLVFLMSCLVTERFDVPKTDRIFLCTVLIGGFMSVSWSFSTGNISILYLLFIALVFYFFIKKRYFISSLFMALMAIFTVFPVIFSSLYIFSDASRVKKVKVIAFAVILVLCSLAVSFFVFPALFQSYVMQFLGKSSPIFELGGFRTPTAYLFFRDFAGIALGNDPGISYVLDFLYIGGVLSIFYSFYKVNHCDHLRLFSFGLISIFLLIPRLKPNYFIFILIPIYLLTVTEKDTIKTLLVLIAAVIPSACHVFLASASLAELAELTKNLIPLIISYNQWLCASAIFLFIAWRDVMGRGVVQSN